MPFDPDYSQPLFSREVSEWSICSERYGVFRQLPRAKGAHLQRYRDVNLGTPITLTTIGIAATSSVMTFQRYTLPRPILGFDRVLFVRE